VWRTSENAETEEAALERSAPAVLLALDRVTTHHTLGRRSITVLDSVSLRVWPRDIVAIWGPRRSGKTTLLRVAGGVEAPRSGLIALDGRDLQDVSSSERTARLRQVAYVPKEWRVARGKPVLDHVALPLLADGSSVRSATRRAWEVLERVGARACARVPAQHLSPSQAARVSLAQALARPPRLLLIDEPGAVTSADERDDLLRLLHSLVADATDLALLITSQNASGIRGASRVMSLADGRLRSVERSASVVPFPARTTSESPP
jgi:ABC-type lipoprotein export system ATPase subunit